MWQNILNEISPFDGKALLQQNGGGKTLSAGGSPVYTAGAVLKPVPARDTVRWTLYLQSGQSGIRAPDDVMIRLNALKAGITIR
jgi:hypothetical protein